MVNVTGSVRDYVRQSDCNFNLINKFGSLLSRKMWPEKNIFNFFLLRGLKRKI